MNKNTMYRSASWNRVSEDYSMHATPMSTTGFWMSATSLDDDEQQPYDPAIEMAKKEKSKAKFAENAVHLIPFVLLACALVLWFFSNPDVDVGIKGDSIAARIEGLTIEGDIDNDSDGTQTGFLPAVELGDSDTQQKQLLIDEVDDGSNIRASRKLVKGSLI